MFTQLRSARRAFLLPVIAVAFSIASCQSQTTETPSSPGASPAADSGSNANVSLTGAGASFPAPLYQRWFSVYNQQNPNVQISYQSIGSGAGVEQFTQGTVDFAASDVAITDKEAAQVERGVITLPMTAGSIVLAYNLPSVETGLRLPREVYTNIFLGKITNWNDPRIAAANPGVSLPDLPITVVRRSDGSGTTAVFTQHLAAISPEWKSKVGAGKTISWPKGIGAKGNEGITAQIQQTQGAIGYVEYGYATQNKLPVAALENQSGNFIAPTPESAARTLEAVELPTDDLIAFITDPAGDQSYPIVTYTWLLAYDQYQDPDEAQALEDFVDWALTEGQKYSAELGYIPLPAKVVAKVQSAAEKIAE